MASKARELLVELYLLKLKYSAADIASLSRAPLAMIDDDLRRLIISLEKLSPDRESSSLRRAPDRRRATFQAKKIHEKDGPVDRGIDEDVLSFTEALQERILLGSPAELRSFAKSIGVEALAERRKQAVDQIGARLREMTPRHARQLMSAARNVDLRASSPYLDLAKTIIGE